MRLTRFTDYTLRTLIYLAARPDRRATIGEIARAFGISGPHLMKVANQLSRTGDVLAIRGAGGGLALARPAAEIGIGAVVRQAEPDLDLAPCFEGEGRCVIQPACVLGTILAEASEAFLAVLDRYTLADLVSEPSLRALLAPSTS